LDKAIRSDRFIVTVPDGAPVLHADERAIAQILDNIISNAVKYSENTGVIHIKWSADRDGRKRLSVQDEGFGIPADLLVYVTEPFTQGTARNDNNALIAKTGTGVGLGLHIVSLLAKLHGAEVDIDSEENRGTSVSVIFPKSA
jgi:signal transduction histidine kinase